MQKIVVFCLPFAGGNQYSYNKYLECVQPNIELIPLDLPGRGKRISESLLTSIDAMADDVLLTIKKYTDRKYAIYGHSMGSLLAYAITHKIIQAELPQPEALFLTSRPGPSVKQRERTRHLLPKVEFFESLRSLGGLENLFTNEDLMNFFEPIFRADLKAVETYQYQKRKPFNIPITVISGKDEDILDEELSAWQIETSLPIEFIKYEGNHFFIFDYAKEVMDIIAQKLFKKSLVI